MRNQCCAKCRSLVIKPLSEKDECWWACKGVHGAPPWLYDMTSGGRHPVELTDGVDCKAFEPAVTILSPLEMEMRKLILQINRDLYPNPGDDDVDTPPGKLSTLSAVMINVILQETRPDRPDCWRRTERPVKIPVTPTRGFRKE